MNLEGVVYFYDTVYQCIFDQISKHFSPAEKAIQSLVHRPIDGALDSVLKKQY